MATEGTVSVLSVKKEGTNIPLFTNQSVSAFAQNSSNDMFLIPETGKYLISYGVATTTPVLISSRVIVNGLKPIAASVIEPPVAIDNLSTSFMAALNAKDTISFQLYGLEATNVELLGGASTYMIVVQLS